MTDSNTATTDSNPDSGEELIRNGEFLFKMFIDLLEIYGSEETLSIVSEEQDIVLAAGIIKTETPGEMDLECVRLAPQQKSLRDCINSIFIN